MGWSRDLGVVTTAGVTAAVAAATARAAGNLSAAESARRDELRNALMTGSPSAADLAELSKLNAISIPTMSPEELATVEKATMLAEMGVEVMGGEAHVVLGASDRIEDQPEAPLKGARQTSITVTVTRTIAPERPAAPVVNTPEKQVDNTVPWEK